MPRMEPNYKMLPQVRGGVAINPYSSLTLTADMDVTSNKTFVPGIKSQVLSVGAEQTILNEFLSLRVGAYKNVQDAASTITPTAGFGLRIFALRVDYRRRAMTSVSVAYWHQALSL